MTSLKTVDAVREMIADGHRSAARDFCKQQLLTLPAGAESSLLQAFLHTLEGRADEAVVAYDTALSFAPDALPAYQGIAQILTGKGWIHSAVVVMENARQATRFTPEAQMELDALRVQVAAAASQPPVSKP